mmetsp:Transcript_39701/g.100002  ORF Transcript_39701/g.100002 Transcript_39701/m.100002 type:complete len:214 (+) Transcript_39701:2397-3038(+)
MLMLCRRAFSGWRLSGADTYAVILPSLGDTNADILVFLAAPKAHTLSEDGLAGILLISLGETNELMHWVEAELATIPETSEEDEFSDLEGSFLDSWVPVVARRSGSTVDRELSGKYASTRLISSSSSALRAGPSSIIWDTVTLLGWMSNGLKILAVLDGLILFMWLLSHRSDKKWIRTARFLQLSLHIRLKSFRTYFWQAWLLVESTSLKATQ